MFDCEIETNWTQFVIHIHICRELINKTSTEKINNTSYPAEKIGLESDP